jgi:hypothetical protein
MFKALGALAFLLVAFVPPASAQDVHVNGYFRSNGTCVQPHYRSHPDASYNNNWSVSPNVNPYTGQVGTRAPTFDDRPPNYGGGGVYGGGLYGYGGNRRY